MGEGWHGRVGDESDNYDERLRCLTFFTDTDTFDGQFSQTHVLNGLYLSFFETPLRVLLAL